MQWGTLVKTWKLLLWCFYVWCYNRTLSIYLWANARLLHNNQLLLVALTSSLYFAVLLYTVGIRKLDLSSFRMVVFVRFSNGSVFEWFGFRMVKTIWPLVYTVLCKNNFYVFIKWFRLINIWKPDIWNPDLPFEIRPLKCPVFECFRFLNGQNSDPHCIVILCSVSFSSFRVILFGN